VHVEKATGDILDVHTVARPVTPDRGCPWCNGLISPAKLQEEGQGERELRAQRYVEEEEVVAPSVITLNATAASRAVEGPQARRSRGVLAGRLLPVHHPLHRLQNSVPDKISVAGGHARHVRTIGREEVISSVVD
jgi:hypothetical protein